MSDLGPALYLGVQEACWRWIPQLRAPASLDGPSSGRLAAVVRYVDDAIAVSRCWCTRCLELLIKEAHPGIPFGLEHSSVDGAIPWLDVQVMLGRWPMYVSASCPERAWLCGDAEHPTKYRLMPWLGHEHYDSDVMCSHIRGKLAKWTQIRLSARDVCRATWYDLMLCWRAGYPPAVVARAWKRFARDHKYSVHVLPLVASATARRTSSS